MYKISSKDIESVLATIIDVSFYTAFSKLRETDVGSPSKSVEILYRGPNLSMVHALDGKARMKEYRGFQ